MKKKCIPVNQYAFETKTGENANEDFFQETAPLIGYIVHRFNSLEEYINSAICESISCRSDIMGLQVIYRRAYSDKVDLFKRISTDFQAAFDKKIPIFEQLYENLKKAGELRNIVVHADWGNADDDGYTLSKLIINGKGVQHEYVQFTPDSLNKIFKLINDTIDMFDQYNEEAQKLI